MSRGLSGRVFLLVAMMGIGGCGEGGTEPPAVPEPPRPTQVAVRPAEARLAALGATVQFTPEVRDQNGQIMSGAAVAWTSSDAVVARVNASGLVTAADNGSATITAAADGVTGTAAVTVEQEAVALTFGPDALAFRALGDTLRLVAEAADANGHPMQVVWTSSDAAVAQVDAAGLVTAVGNGSARITATAGAEVRSAVVVVEQVAVALALTPESVRIRALGDTLRLIAEAADANGHSIESVTWTSADAEVATVDSAGLVTARSNGSARITATASGQTSSATVTVEQEAVALGGLPTADTLLWYGEPGDTLRLAVTSALDANGHTVQGISLASVPVEWSTSPSGVATVDDGGLVLGAAEGVATITATAASLGGANASAELVVVNRDRATLAAFYHATGGPDWSCNENWVTHAPMGDWCGVRTSVRDDGVVMVTELRLSDNNLTGSVPPELGELARLESLDLGSHHPGNGNQLTGPIPPELGELANLRELDLGSGSLGNQLTGPIPRELGKLVNLRSLDLHGHRNRGNQLTGPIPLELGNLVHLNALSLGDNQLTGSIPPELGKLANLNALSLRNNQLVGSIPLELGNLTWLTYLDLGENRLKGPIPLELGNLRNLYILRLGGNLTGPIPPELGNLTQLGELSVPGSQLTGPIPLELGNLHNLYILSLRNNQLTGSIPLALGNLPRLRNLDLSGNQLTGSIPAELGSLVNLALLDFRNNQLSGPIPPELGNLTWRLSRLDLSGNQLTGPVPPELGNLVHLNTLSLGDNQLTGSIPPELGRLNVNHLYRGPGYLNLANNQLTGPIPPELANFALLSSLDLSGNQLTGPIPVELGNISWLRLLRLHGNTTLGGRLPEVFTQLQLSIVFWDDTQLCHPPTPAFRQWLQGIRNHRGGPPCGS